MGSAQNSIQTIIVIYVVPDKTATVSIMLSCMYFDLYTSVEILPIGLIQNNLL